MFKNLYLYILVTIQIVIFSQSLQMASAEENFVVEAYVNGEIITNYDLSQRIKLLELINESFENEKLQTKQSLIDELLQLQLAKKLNITINEKTLQNDFNEKLEYLNQSYSEFVKTLLKNDITIETYKKYLKADILWKEVLIRKFANRARMSDYRLNKPTPTAAKKIPSTLNLSEIIIPFAERGKKTTLLLAERLYLELKAGGDFASAARRFSQASTAQKGGNIGFVQKKLLPQFVLKEIENMDPGDISRPQILPESVVIFKLHDILNFIEPKKHDYLVEYIVTNANTQNPLELCKLKKDNKVQSGHLLKLKQNLKSVLTQAVLFEYTQISQYPGKWLILCSREIDVNETESLKIKSDHFNAEMRIFAEKLMIQLYSEATIK